MKELFIHIGFGKCASSSIQHLFTKNALFCNDGKSYKYIGFDDKNRIVDNNTIAEKLNFPPHHFTTNISAEPKKLKRQLESIINDKCDVGIISNESLANPDWLTDGAFKCFADIDVKISIFLVLRRFDHWLNSSWWQWGAFSNSSLAKWVMNHKLTAFHIGVEKWLKLPNVKNFTCVDLCENPLEVVANKLGIAHNDKTVINAASSADMLRFLIKNKDILKRSVHSPQIEFILNNELNFSGDKPPFVISDERKKGILQEYEAALSVKLNGNIKRLFKNHFTHLSEELNNNKLNYGKCENFSMDDFLNQRSDPAFLERLNETLVKRLQVPLIFSAESYLYFNPDIKAKGVDPYRHYLEFGLKEGRRIR